MKRAELLHRIEGALAEKDLSASAASRRATGRPDFIRDLKRHPESKVDAGKLAALARVLGVTPAYLVDETVKRAAAVARDPAIWKRAAAIADRTLRGSRAPRKAGLHEKLTERIYNVIEERVAAGTALDDPALDGLVTALMRQLAEGNFLRWDSETAA
jgi:hypothetical protein